MKKTLAILLFTISISIQSYSQQTNPNDKDRFHLNGEFKNDNYNGIKIYLYDDFDLKKIDSTIVTERKFLFSGLINEPSLYRVILDDRIGTNKFFLESKSLNLLIEPDFKNWSIRGNELNEEFLEVSNRLAGRFNFSDLREPKKFAEALINEFNQAKNPYVKLICLMQLSNKLSNSNQTLLLSLPETVRNGRLATYLK